MASIWGELQRRNVVRVSVAYAVVGWLLIEIASTILPTFGAPSWVLPTITFLIILGFPLALVLSWVFDVTPRGVERTASAPEERAAPGVAGRKLDFAIIGLLAVAVAFMFVDNYLPESGPFAGAEIDPASLEPDPVESGPGIGETAVLPNSVAVLLCDNLSPDPDDAYFAAGIHDEILNQLFKLGSLNPISRNAVLQYGDNPPPIPQVAEELRVESVMECSVRYAGDSVLVTAQLIDPETNLHLWADTYEGDLSDLSTVFAIQADIAMNIANALEAEFSPEERDNIGRQSTESREAYLQYMQAVAALDAGNSDAARIYLDEAITLDPDFALALAVSAHRYVFDLLGVSGSDPAQADEYEREAREAAERALEIDETLGPAHAALAAIHYVNGRIAEAEEAFQQAYQFGPNSNLAAEYGRFKRSIGEYDEAVRIQRDALALDPGNAMLEYQLGLSHLVAENFDEAADIFRRAIASTPGNAIPHLHLAQVELGLGNTSTALAEARRAHSLFGEDISAFRLGELISLYAVAGSSNDVEMAFNDLQSLDQSQPVGSAVWAEAYLATGETQQALFHLRRAVGDPSPADLITLNNLARNEWNNPDLERPDFRALLDGYLER